MLRRDPPAHKDKNLRSKMKDSALFSIGVPATHILMNTGEYLHAVSVDVDA